jgi:hypothetical protein
MKKWVLVFVVLLVYTSTAIGDSAGPGGRYIATEVLISNLDQYPDIVLLAYSESENNNSVYVVSQNQSLPQGYVAGYGYVYGVQNLLAIRKDVLEAEGGVETIDLDVLKRKHTPAIVISSDGYYISTYSSPLASQSYRYRITGVTADTVFLKLYQGIFTFSDGRNSEIVSY